MMISMEVMTSHRTGHRQLTLYRLAWDNIKRKVYSVFYRGVLYITKMMINILDIPRYHSGAR